MHSIRPLRLPVASLPLTAPQPPPHDAFSLSLLTIKRFEFFRKTMSPLRRPDGPLES
eukprot:CAMPEP_0173403606 /NCGR_PEP_ID=MMETSP1356-20130122/57247_1 /TAXON_ID=77927 ORGANISM="Hemiselmis virescens, Strain PCC157" /NCGR_SAMPLE_ID=MMETSP1356 /ASSEMBLY_ACC=CAM_ASM_000847 /LENGTH=56 /DNA_ID=CAMNT_0014364157 /DNA_START=1 /DNA_END=167 /DNA_ORIENTATION=+